MVTINIVYKKELFTSSSNEQELYTRHFKLNVLKEPIEFTFSELVPFESFINTHSEELLVEILSNLKAVTKGLISFKSSEGLKLYYKETMRYFLILSIGEFQPGLHKIYIEGIFEKYIS
ncbi:MAG: hypothetical protein JNL60_11415 [Bacteroidia bacterium]|nr:hypothetical protein [Bacteroidia bacterium]